MGVLCLICAVLVCETFSRTYPWCKMRPACTYREHSGMNTSIIHCATVEWFNTNHKTKAQIAYCIQVP